VPPAERTGVGAIPTAQGGGRSVGGVGIPEGQQNVGGGGRRVVGAEDGGLVNGAGRTGGGDEDLQLQGGEGWRERGCGEQRGQVQRDIEGVGGGVTEDGQGGARAGGAIGLEDLEATVGGDDQQGIPGDGGLSLEWEPVHAAGAALQCQVEVVVELVDTGEQVEADMELVAGAAQVDGKQVVGGEVGVSGVEQAQVGVAPGGEDGGRGRQEAGRQEAGRLLDGGRLGAAGSQAEGQEEAVWRAEGHKRMIPWDGTSGVVPPHSYHPKGFLRKKCSFRLEPRAKSYQKWGEDGVVLFLKNKRGSIPAGEGGISDF